MAKDDVKEPKRNANGVLVNEHDFPLYPQWVEFPDGHKEVVNTEAEHEKLKAEWAKSGEAKAAWGKK